MPILAACLFLIVAPQTKLPYEPKLDAFLKAEVKAQKIPSVAVAVVKFGKVVYAKAFGFADLESRVPASPETVYRLGSITKQFTATMILQLVVEKKLGLQDQVGTLLPETPKQWAKVTVSQLLSHTSGIKNYTEVSGLFDGPAMKPTRPEGILQTVATNPLDFEPGAKWNYSNTGYELLGMLVEKLDKRSFEASLKARILTPLGMNSTFFTSEQNVISRRAQGYTMVGSALKHAHYLNMDWPYAAGSMESTVLDLAKWDAALYGGKILPQSVLDQMWTPVKLTNGEQTDYGYGWFIDKVNGKKLVGHGGGIHGFNTVIRRVPSRGITVIALISSDSANPSKIGREVMELADPALKVAELPVSADPLPEATKDARSILESVIHGTLDRSRLSPDFAKVATEEKIRSLSDQLSKLGPISKFEFVKESEKNQQVTRQYQFSLGPTSLRLEITTDASKAISRLAVHP